MTPDTLPIRPAPAVSRNGLPGWKPYVYRGTGEDRLTAWMDEAPKPKRVRVADSDRNPGQRRELMPCGTPAAVRRHTRRHEQMDPACRQWANQQRNDRRARRRYERETS